MNIEKLVSEELSREIHEANKKHGVPIDETAAEYVWVVHKGKAEIVEQKKLSKKIPALRHQEIFPAFCCFELGEILKTFNNEGYRLEAGINKNGAYSNLFKLVKNGKEAHGVELWDEVLEHFLGAFTNEPEVRVNMLLYLIKNDLLK